MMGSARVRLRSNRTSSVALMLSQKMACGAEEAVAPLAGAEEAGTNGEKAAPTGGRRPSQF